MVAWQFRVGRQLAQARRRAEAANHAKDEFMAVMSHELRTPLNGVVAVAEVLAMEQTEPRAREQAELIASSGRLLERVLSDILDVSKMEAGKFELDHAASIFRPWWKPPSR